MSEEQETIPATYRVEVITHGKPIELDLNKDVIFSHHYQDGNVFMVVATIDMTEEQAKEVLRKKAVIEPEESTMIDVEDNTACLQQTLQGEHIVPPKNAWEEKEDE